MADEVGEYLDKRLKGDNDDEAENNNSDADAESVYFDQFMDALDANDKEAAQEALCMFVKCVVGNSGSSGQTGLTISVR